MTPEEWFGVGAREPKRVALRAGPLHLTYVNGDLRDVMCGPHEVLRRIYLVFQDRNWTARPWRISDERIVAGRESFEITYHAQGTFDAEAFEVDVELSGDSDGTFSFTVDGTASRAFIRNRLGLCVLHPMAAAGHACLVEDISGDTREALFPLSISPDQPFVDIRAITHEFMPGAWASTRMLGETFEMEDHRNWSDASFKTYCTPISLPFPVTVEPGDAIWQQVVVAVDIEDVTIDPAPSEITISLLPDSSALPELGLQINDEQITSEQMTRLRELGLGHLRVDIDAGDPQAVERLGRAVVQAQALEARLVVALFVTDVAQLVPFAAFAADVDTWLVFDPKEKVAGAELAAAARAVFGEHARIGGGTNLYFTELNRQPPTHALDVVAFSVNPQVHASDSLTLVQNLAAQAVIAREVPRIARDASVHVGPVTLRPRFNPNATEPDLDHSNTPLPANVDARQAAGLGAAWTAMSIKYLAEPGTVEAVTYYETVGWRGVLESSSGSPQPADFGSTAGDRYPLFETFAAVAGFERVRHSVSSAPQHVDALVVTDGEGRARLLIANFDDAPHTVRLSGFGSLTSMELPALSFDIQDVEGM